MSQSPFLSLPSPTLCLYTFSTHFLCRLHFPLFGLRLSFSVCPSPTFCLYMSSSWYLSLFRLCSHLPSASSSLSVSLLIFLSLYVSVSFCTSPYLSIFRLSFHFLPFQLHISLCLYVSYSFYFYYMPSTCLFRYVALSVHSLFRFSLYLSLPSLFLSSISVSVSFPSLFARLSFNLIHVTCEI